MMTKYLLTVTLLLCSAVLASAQCRNCAPTTHLSRVAYVYNAERGVVDEEEVVPAVPTLLATVDCCCDGCMCNACECDAGRRERHAQRSTIHEGRRHHHRHHRRCGGRRCR